MYDIAAVAAVAQWQSIRLVNERSVVRFHIVAKHQRTGIILQTTPCPCITFHYALSRLVTPTGSAPPSNHSKAQQQLHQLVQMTIQCHERCYD